MKVSADLEVDLRNQKLLRFVTNVTPISFNIRYAFNKYFIISPNFPLF